MRKHFGTQHDGEYLPLATKRWWNLLLYLCQPFVIPIIAVVRFLVLAPISWLSRPFRDWLHRHASSMVMDPRYIRPLPSRQALRIFRLQEALCFLWAAGVAAALVERVRKFCGRCTASEGLIDAVNIRRHNHDRRELLDCGVSHRANGRIKPFNTLSKIVHA